MTDPSRDEQDAVAAPSDGTTIAPLHGITFPGWYVRLRGRRWLRSGFCPCCYSSPPLPTCPVCEGAQTYGNHGNRWRPGITPELRALWAARWDRLS